MAALEGLESWPLKPAATPLSRCPACRNESIERATFVSEKGFLCEPGYAHSRCRGCATVFVDPQPSERALGAFYRSRRMEGRLERTMAQDSAKRVLDPSRREYFWSQRVEPIRRRLRPGARVFDAGCGVGAFVRAMREEGFDCAGSDVSSASIAAGRTVLGLPPGALFRGHVDEIPGSGYDLISGWTIIEHLREPEAFVRRVARKLAPRGYLIVEFPTVDSLMFERLGKDFYWVMPPYHLHLFSLKGMRALLKRQGFTVEEVRPMPVNWYWFDAIAKRAGVGPAQLARMKAEAPAFMLEVDRLLDGVAFSLGRSSVVQVIARRAA